MEKVNLSDKLRAFSEYWSPRIVGELNGQHVKLAKMKGEFIWHQHEHADELFLVIRGSLEVQLEDRTVMLDAGEVLIVPRGVRHRPIAREEAHVLLFEPAGTLNTGDVLDERSVLEPQRV